LESQIHQLQLWDDLSSDNNRKASQLQDALDELHQRFGQESIRKASDLPIKARNSTKNRAINKYKKHDEE
jgi:hypothetical protein